MPTYEYQCRKCKKQFSVMCSFAEYEQKKVKCPKCESTQVDHRMSLVGVKTSKKS